MTRRSNHAHAEEFRRPSAPLEALPLFGGEPVPVPVKHVVEVRAHLRTIGGEAPPSGREKRDAAVANHEHEEAKRSAVTYLRAQLAALYRTRCVDPAWRLDPFVTADDIEQQLRQWAACPRVLHEIPGHWKGAVFRTGWMQTGRSVDSIRPRMKATRLPCWRLRDASERRAAS